MPAFTQNGNIFVYGINYEVVPLPPHLETELFLSCQRQIAYSVPAFIVCALSDGSALRYTPWRIAALHR